MPNLGPNPVGYLHYSPGKRMCAVLMKPERPAWAVRAMARASDADVASAARGFTALCGRFEVDEAKGLVTHHAEIALAPHGVGHARQRHYAFDGDRLVLRPLPPYGKGVVSVSLTWERVRE